MTGRERFRETMRGGTPDRVPYFEEGLRDDVLDRWREQGLPPGADLAAMFATDFRERVPVDIEPRPAIEEWPRTVREVERLRERLDPDDPARYPADWDDRVRAWRSRDHVLELFVHRGFFLSMGVRAWRSFEPVVYLLKDDPALVHAIMDLQGEFAARIVDRVLAEVEVDMVAFSEPIGGNDRPLLSPGTYREFVLASYAPALAAIRRRQVAATAFVTYANARVLLPKVIAAGFDCLWACEVNNEAMDYLDIRREFGPDLGLIGGIDLDTLLQDPAAIEREMEAKVPPLLAQGRYIPLADGRVRAEVPFANYAHYRRTLARLTTG